MKAPVSMINAASGSPTAVVIAILVGLYVVSKMKQPTLTSAAATRR